jgi:hypothetical protein
MSSKNEELAPHEAVLLRILSRARHDSEDSGVTFRDDEPDFRSSVRELARRGYLEVRRTRAGQWSVFPTEMARGLHS